MNRCLPTEATMTSLLAGESKFRKALFVSVAVTALAALMPAMAEAQHTGVKTPDPEIEVPARVLLGPPSADPLVAAIDRKIVEGTVEEFLDDDFGPGVLLAVRKAYAQRVFQPVWSQAGTAALRAELKDHFAYGLVIEDLDLRDIDRLTETRFEGEPKDQARADIKLTGAFIRLANAVSGGLRDEGGVETSNDDAPNRAILTSAIIEAGRGDVKGAFAELEPEHPQFAALKRALRTYREIKANGGWLAIPDGDLVKPGDRDARLPALRARLEVEGYETEFDPLAKIETVSASTGMTGLPSSEVPASTWTEKVGPDVHDPGLVSALKEFQRRHGLEPDGVLGPNTLRALNESVGSKIDRIVDNMYRWRGQGDLGPRYVWANIPSFTAEGWANGQREITMRTIVGLPSRETPVFSDEIEFVVTNPRWYAPVSIVRRDKLPKMQEDPGYAQRGHYQIFDRATNERVDPYLVDWTDPASARKYRFVQMPGDHNALGKLKIMFPNQYSVYMHGTPGKHLFDRAQRTFSSGCVRLEDPVAMARWLAKHDDRLEESAITERIESRERKWLKSDEETAIHITYFTVTEGPDGKINFWRDVYNRGDGIEFAEKFAPLYTAPVGTAESENPEKEG